MRKFYSFLILFFILSHTQAQIVTQAWATLASDAKPEAIAVDASGNVYTANTGTGNYTISKITPDGTLTQQWAWLNYQNPRAIAVTNGVVYTLNKDNSISKVTTNGSEATSVASGWANLASGADARAIAIDASGNLYTANYGNNTVSKITPDGTLIEAWANVSNRPTSIAIDANGNVYTANSIRNSVSKITPAGTVTQEWVRLGFSTAKRIVIGANGNIYTANFSNTVSKITPDGTMTEAWASLPNTIGFNEIAVDANGDVYTANSDNTVSKITSDGNFTQVWASLASGANPKGIAIANSVYTVNFNNTVSKVDYCSTTANIIATAPKRCGLNGSIELNTLTGNTNLGSNNFNSNNLSTALSGPWSGNVGGNANGKLYLTQILSNTNGYLLFTPTTKPASFSAAFDLNMYRSTTINGGAGDGDRVADGLSFNYGAITTPSGNYEDGILSGNGLVVRYKIYQTQRIEVVYNGVVKGTYYADLHYPTAIKCMIAVSQDGKFSMRLGDSIVVNNLDLGTAYATDSKSAWKFGWAARSGGSYEGYGIDNIVVDNNNGFQYSIDNFATQQPLPFFKPVPGSYTVKSKTASCSNQNTVGTATIPAYSIPNLKAIEDVSNTSTCQRFIRVTHDAVPYDTLVWSDFATRPTISNANNMGNANVNGSLSLTGTGNDQRGQMVFNPSKNASVFNATFKVRIGDGNGADGFSFNYGAVDNMSGGQDGMFNTGTPGLSIGFLTYQNQRIRVRYKNVTIVNDRPLSDYQFSIRTGEYHPVEISVSPDYKLTVKIIKNSLTPNPVTLTIIDNYDLNANTTYASDNHSNWQFGIAGFTGGANDNHNIENLLITGRPGFRYSFDGVFSPLNENFVNNSAQVVKVNMDGCEVTAANFPAWNGNEIAYANTTKSSFLYSKDTRIFGECGPNLIGKVQSYDSTGTPIQGNMAAQVWIENTQPTNFVKRHYQITPSNATGNEAFVSLYFTQADFDAYNAVNTTKLPTSPSDATGKANLRVEKRSGSSNDGTGLPTSYTGTTINIDPADNNITWDVAKNMWEVKFYVKGFSGFFVNTASAVLPIELLSFEASAQKGTNLLTWRTASEINNLGFDIERSQDGLNFQTITRVKGKNKPSTYQYVDDAVYNTTYYRLKQIDNDGKTSYSQIVNVEQKGIKKGLKVYPTLVSSNILNVDTEGVSSDYNIYNLMGQIVKTGKTGQSIEVSDLVKGTYIIKVGAESAKFVKQ
jgi:hypothetical protein